MTTFASFGMLAGLLALAALLLLGLSFIFAQLIGWRTLVRRFPASHGRGDRFGTKGTVIGTQSWNGPPLFITLDDSGVTLVPKRVFRPAFAPILIPWERVESFARREYLLFEVVELRFGSEETSSIGFVPSQATAAIAARIAANATPAPLTLLRETGAPESAASPW